MAKGRNRDGELETQRARSGGSCRCLRRALSKLCGGRSSSGFVYFTASFLSACLLACVFLFGFHHEKRKADVDAAPQTARLAARLNLRFRAIWPAFFSQSIKEHPQTTRIYKDDDRRQTTDDAVAASRRLQDDAMLLDRMADNGRAC